MVTTTFSDVITSEEELREYIGWPTERAKNKQISHLDQHCRRLIAASPFVLLSSSRADGRCDVSPKGDAAGFVQVLDDHTLAIPDRPGNKRLDTLTNFIANPQVGLLFLIPGMQETLRVNGRVALVRDQALLDTMAVSGKKPLLAIVVSVEEVFIHCAKAMLRSKLWHTDTWPGRDTLPSMAEILRDHALNGECDIEALEADLAERNRNTLY